MVITRTPFRISFFGGGTDYPAWFKENGGAVLATTIDKYCYITCRVLPPFFEHKHRIVYSVVENVRNLEEIKHPSVREVLKWSGVKSGLEIHHDGDLPARSGLGSSSSFTAGLIKALKALSGEMIEAEQLAKDAIHVEQDLIGEAVGCQDQISAAYGGFNKITFRRDGTFFVEPVVIPKNRRDELQSHLLLFFTGLSRYSSEVAQTKIANIGKKTAELNAMRQMVDEGLAVLQSSTQSIQDFGRLLDESWEFKKSLSEMVSNTEIDGIYRSAKESGALGGKLLGAGAGGFLLLFAEPALHDSIKSKLKHLINVPFSIASPGSQIVLYQPDGL